MSCKPSGIFERLWNARQYVKLFGSLIANRPESTFRLEIDTPTSTLAAAMGIIRLDELNQPMCRFTAPSSEHWSPPRNGTAAGATRPSQPVSARPDAREGASESIQRGLRYLADLQKSDGLWPKIPFRRMPGDACVSAFVLHQLSGDERFRAVVRFNDAVSWLRNNRHWNQKRTDCGIAPVLRCKAYVVREPMLVWS